MIKIDKNKPMPETRLTYPFRSMEVGDSFFVPGKTTRAMAGAVAGARKRLGLKFAARTITENRVTGVRIWRVE